MEVAIGEYETDVDTLAEAAENKCKQVDSKAITKTGKSVVSLHTGIIINFARKYLSSRKLSKPYALIRITFSNILP